MERVCNPRTGEVETRGSEVQGHSRLLSEFEANLGYLRPYLKKQKQNHEKPDDLRLIPGPHMVEGEPLLIAVF